MNTAPDGFSSVAPYFFVADAAGRDPDPSGNLWWVSQRLAPGGYSH